MLEGGDGKVKASKIANLIGCQEMIDCQVLRKNTRTQNLEIQRTG